MTVEAMADLLFEPVDVGIGCVGVRTPSGVLSSTNFFTEIFNLTP